MTPTKTCLDCGFLTIQARQLDSSDRILLGTYVGDQGHSAVMPANPEGTRCFKGLWHYNLHYTGDSFDAVIEELGCSRDDCPGFASYVAGLTPAQHLEIELEQRKEQARTSARRSTRRQVAVDSEKDHAFIAMPMSSDGPALDDVLDGIKAAALSCGINAERIDEQERNERITDRILESIDKATFVVADFTHARPNVFYEAGYALGVGKIPVYIARKGTKLEFDL